MDSSAGESLPVIDSNETVVARIVKDLDFKVQEMVKKIYEEHNACVVSLQEMSHLYSHIPIISDEGFEVTFQMRSFMDETVHRLEVGENNTFLLFPRDNGNTMEISYDGIAIHLVKTFYTTANNTYFGSKRVTVGVDDYQETATSITLPPRPPHISGDDYGKYVYRTQEGIVVDESQGFDPDLFNERQSVFIYAGVPWLKKTLPGVGCCSIILRNLHTGDVRRYLLDIDDPMIFYAGDEFYYFEEVKDYYETRTNIKQCRSKKVVTTFLSSVFDVVSCREYVVILSMHGAKFTILSLV